MRGRGFSQDHLLSRPTGRAVALHHHHQRRRAALSGAAFQRQSRAPGGFLGCNGRRPPHGHLARSLPETELLVRAGRRRFGAARGRVRHLLRSARGAVHLLRAAQHRSMRLRHGRTETRHALGRAAVRARVRPRHLHDRRCRELQHGRDGEQRAERLQHLLYPRNPRYRHRRRLSAR